MKFNAIKEDLKRPLIYMQITVIRRTLTVLLIPPLCLLLFVLNIAKVLVRCAEELWETIIVSSKEIAGISVGLWKGKIK